MVGDGVWANYQQHPLMTDAEARNPTLFPVGWSTEQNDSIIILGQSRDKTILRVQDDCPGFGAGAAKPVPAFFRLKCGSCVNQNNVVENLTVDTGRGNPGAIGIRWNSANTGAIRNLTVRSGDSGGCEEWQGERDQLGGLFAVEHLQDQKRSQRCVGNELA